MKTDIEQSQNIRVKPDILQVEDLRVYYHTGRGPVKAVNGINFSLKQGERLGLVGESGSGKSTIALALLRMIKPPGRIEGGSARLGDVDLFKLSDEQMRRTRLAELSMVAQGAMNSINPVKKIRHQFADGLRDHEVHMDKQELNKHIADLLNRVGLRPEVADMFPHELSGGMKQRVIIAIAISMQPKLIIADEPTSALDVVVQRQVIETLRKVQEDIGAAVILIGHDMGLMAQFADRVGVMYAGNLVEVAEVRDLFREPLHPYSQLLIGSLPSLKDRGVLQGIPGLPPSLLNRPTGCPFNTRCPHAMERCFVEEPPLKEYRPNHFAACHLYEETA